MYFKMAFNNVKKSFKDYTIYFLTITFAVCIFYSFNSINNQTIIGEMNEGQVQYVDLMNEFISILSIGVSVILGCLIIYATNFLIKKRKKEFGVYMALGMKKRSMSIILFLETLYIGLISLIEGLILGLVFAQVLSVFTAKLFVLEMSKYTFVISSEAILKTILYFGFMYVLVMIFNVFVVSKYKLIDLLYANKKNESIKVKNIYVSLGILVASIIMLGYAYYYINVSGLNFLRYEFKLSIILGIVGTLLFFYGISAVMLKLLQKKSDIYFNKLNCFSVKQICSKFNTNFISMSVICLMLLVTIGTLACSLTVKDSMEDTIKKSTPFDASVEIIDRGGVGNGTSLIDTLKNEGYNLGENDDYMEFKVYTDKTLPCSNYIRKYIDSSTAQDLLGNAFFNSTTFIKISDFNNLRKFNNQETIELKEDQVLVACNYDPIIDGAEKFANNEQTIDIKGRKYNIKQKEVIKDYTETSPTATTIFAFIVPDSLVESNHDTYLSTDAINLNFKGENKAESEKKLTKILNRYMNDASQNVDADDDEYYLYGMTKQMCIDSARGLSTMILFISVYIGIVFLLASAAVLALQQLSSCNESIERYKSLRKIGATKKMINKSILYQVGVFFILPLTLAVIHSFVGIKVVNSYLITLGSSNQFKSILVTALIMIIVYGGYLYGTYISYKNVIDNEFN